VLNVLLIFRASPLDLALPITSCVWFPFIFSPFLVLLSPFSLLPSPPLPPLLSVMAAEPSSSVALPVTAPSKLLEVIRNPILLESFQLFCEEELAGENLSFWLDADAFHRIEDEDERVRQFNALYDKYFDVDSSTEINISGMRRLTLLSTLSFFISLSLHLRSFSHILLTLDCLICGGVRVCRRESSHL
jgi:hypothetical protein